MYVLAPRKGALKFGWHTSDLCASNYACVYVRIQMRILICMRSCMYVYKRMRIVSVYAGYACFQKMNARQVMTCVMHPHKVCITKYVFMYA